MESLFDVIILVTLAFGAGVAFGTLYVEQKLDALRYGDKSE